MNATEGLVLALIIVIIAGFVILYLHRRRSEALREKFGPEYQRTVSKLGDERKAEAELSAREERVRKLEIRTLRPEEQERFVNSWKRAQARFVDEPSQAATEADILVQDLMKTRGYPIGD